jgi:hypothetical protein
MEGEVEARVEHIAAIGVVAVVLGVSATPSSPIKA